MALSVLKGKLCRTRMQQNLGNMRKLSSFLFFWAWKRWSRILTLSVTCNIELVIQNKLQRGYTLQSFLWEILSSHSGEDENVGLLGCDSQARPEDRDSMFLWIVGIYPQVHTASKPRRATSSHISMFYKF